MPRGVLRSAVTVGLATRTETCGQKPGTQVIDAGQTIGKLRASIINWQIRKETPAHKPIRLQGGFSCPAPRFCCPFRAVSFCDNLLASKADFHIREVRLRCFSLLNGRHPWIFCDSRVPCGSAGRTDSVEVSSDPGMNRTFWGAGHQGPAWPFSEKVEPAPLGRVDGTRCR